MLRKDKCTDKEWRDCREEKMGCKGCYYDEIEVGNYVRTKEGIIDKVIINYHGVCNSLSCNCKHVSCKKDYYYEEDIVKHSKDILDLIEVGDVIKFKNKLHNSLENEEMIIHIFDNDTLNEVKQAMQKQEIELLSIVTKEQFKSVEYEVNKC